VAEKHAVRLAGSLEEAAKAALADREAVPG